MKISKSTLLAEMSGNLTQAASDLASLASQRLKRLSFSDAEAIVIDAVTRRPLRLALLVNPRPIDPRILMTWWDEAKP